MIQITPHMRIYQCLEPVDFRNGIDGLASLCRRKLNADPMSGALFIFVNRRRTSFKLLVYDGQGFWLCQKRFSDCRIKNWRGGNGELSAPELQVILYNGSPVGFPADWKKIRAA